MKRLAVLLAAVLVVGTGSPSLADDLKGKWFWVMLLDDVDGSTVDYGWFTFWEHEDGYEKLTHIWLLSGAGSHTFDREMDEDEGCVDYGGYGSAWSAWPEDGHKGPRQDCPYEEFDWFYCKPWGKLTGHAQQADDPVRKYSLWGIFIPQFPPR